MRDRASFDDRRLGAGPRERLGGDFDLADLTRKGELTLGEFMRFTDDLDEDITAEECQIEFDEIDSNRDGRIAFEEFMAWWAQRT